MGFEEFDIVGGEGRGILEEERMLRSGGEDLCKGFDEFQWDGEI